MTHEIYPELLYHYTTPEGMLGVLKSGSLWATHASYLNDSKEIRHGFEMVVSVASECAAVARESVSGLMELLLIFWGVPVVGCFTEEGDDLSQWRGYSRGGGVALGFDGGRLAAGVAAAAPSHLDTSLRKVEYRLDHQRAIIAGLVEKSGLVEAAQKFDPDLPRDGFMRGVYPVIEALDEKVLPELMAEVAYVKHPGFSSEKEWRLTREFPDWRAGEVADLEFRGGSVGLVPYVPVRLIPEGSLLPLREVVLGPGFNGPLQEGAVKLLLFKHGYEDVDVLLSRIPFRG